MNLACDHQQSLKYNLVWKGTPYTHETTQHSSLCTQTTSRQVHHTVTSTYFRQLTSNNKQRGALSTTYVSADKIRVADKATISLPGPSLISPVHASCTNGSILFLSHVRPSRVLPPWPNQSMNETCSSSSSISAAALGILFRRVLASFLAL